mgnify:CR=1 FL=1
MTSPSILQSVTIRAVFLANGEVWSVRTRATLGSEIPPIRRASKFFASSACFASLLGRGKLRTAIEHAISLASLAVRLFQTLKTWSGFCNLQSGRTQLATGLLSSRVHDCNQSRGIFTVLSGPSPLLSASHVNHKAWSSQHEVHEKSVRGA